MYLDKIIISSQISILLLCKRAAAAAGTGTVEA
jgi:hypothetical protein